MIEEQDIRVTLQDNFYRDSFRKVIFIILCIAGVIAALIVMSFYIYWSKPPPVTFHVFDEMRVVKPVPLSEHYLSTTDLVQWVTDVLPNSFNVDFYRYNAQLKEHAKSFTQDGWKAFLNQLNIYANYNNVQSYKLFVTGSPAAAPIILNQDVLENGKYHWWVQIPININYAGLRPPQNATVTLQALVVRVPTLNNLTGVEIDNVIQAPVPVTTQ